jgi:hypothetical protein
VLNKIPEWLACLLLQDIVSNSSEVSPLQIGIEVDLADAIADGLLELLLGRSGTAVEDKEYRLVCLGVGLLLDVLLMLVKKFWMQLDITRLGIVNIYYRAGVKIQTL